LAPSTPNYLPARAFIAIVLAALVLISPTFFLGQISGNDFNFHLQSWMEVVNLWHQGVSDPSWAAAAYNGFGEPRFIFYPPITWLAGAVLGAALPWKIVPDLFLFLTLLLAGVSMHRLARSYLSPEASLAAALIYMTNPYFLVDLYVRSPFAELLAAAILPLAVHFVLNCAPSADLSPRTQRRVRYQNIALLAITFAAIWLTNAPMAVVTSYALAFLLIVQAIHRRSLAPLLTGGAALALGLLLASLYIFPATYEQPWVSIGEAITAGLVFADALMFRWIHDPHPDRIAILVTTVSTFEIVVAIGAALILRKRTRETGTAWIAIFALVIFSTVIMLPFTGSLLQYLPKMRYIQFPWRWLIPLGVGFSFFLGGAIAASRRKIAISVAYLTILLALAIFLGTRLSWWDSSDVRETLADIATGSGFEGTGEYGPAIGDPPNLVENSPLVSLLPEGTKALATAPRQPVSGNMAIESWLDQRKEFAVSTPTPVVAALHLMSFPAWQVRVNDQPAAAHVDPTSGQMLLQLPGGISHVEIRFGWTPDRTIGWALSGMGILILSGIIFIGWRTVPALPNKDARTSSTQKEAH
jgi:hypothetical protein